MTKQSNFVKLSKDSLKVSVPVTKSQCTHNFSKTVPLLNQVKIVILLHQVKTVLLC